MGPVWALRLCQQQRSKLPLMCCLCRHPNVFSLAPLRGRVSQVALVVKNPPANAGDIRDVGSIPGLGRSPGGGHGNPLPYSCLKNAMDRGPWQAMVHGLTKSWTILEQLITHALLIGRCYYYYYFHSEAVMGTSPLCPS